MSLMEHVYSVMIVSAADKLNSSVLSLLPSSRYQPVRVVSSVNAAKRAWNERSYDYIIINSPLPDDAGVGFAMDTASSAGTVVLMLLREEVMEEIRSEAVSRGVFTLTKPVSRSLMALALDWMESARERLRMTEKKTLSFEEKMEEIRLVNRAKWILISQLKMDEPRAHRYIEKQAMDRCVSKREIAEEIIATY
ncbi:MAG: ANTAR domain-containing protein [Eubacteriaceae bacterium]|nr:ANTAR domain-containing protein [Eubacteriaceae bacterium]